MAHVLIIEEAPLLAVSLTRTHRYAVTVASSVRLGVTMLAAAAPDLVVLDLRLTPSGGAVLEHLRSARDVPVIVTSERDDDPRLSTALDAGAADFVVAPFTAERLEARIRGVLQRTSGALGASAGYANLVIGGLALDVPTRQATLHDEPLTLTPREFDLLVRLAASHGEVVSRAQLLADVWHQTWSGSEKTVDVHLSWLRRKLGESAAEPRFLHTVRGVGVRLVAPER